MASSTEKLSIIFALEAQRKAEEALAAVESAEAVSFELALNGLPTENISTSTIYLVPSSNSVEDSQYEEWVYITDVGWEKMGIIPVANIPKVNLYKLSALSENSAPSEIISAFYDTDNIDLIISTAENRGIVNGVTPLYENYSTFSPITYMYYSPEYSYTLTSYTFGLKFEYDGYSYFIVFILRGTDYSTSIVSSMTKEIITTSGGKIDTILIGEYEVEIDETTKTANFPIATNEICGAVSGTTENDGIAILENGSMKVNNLSFSKLYIEEETELVFCAGSASN